MEHMQTSDIIYQVELVQRRITKFKKDISNKNVIACLGNSRSGKSTLINFMLDNELTSCAKGNKFLISSDLSGNGPSVKHGCTSHTKFPSIWPSQINDRTVFVDFPGFDDNRGVIRNIINIIFMNQLTHANSVKFVVVSDINNLLNDNINEFTELMTNMQSIILDFSAVSLIFTKAAVHISVAQICSLLQEKILEVDELAVQTDLISHLAENRNQIGILKAPVRPGSIQPDEIDCNVKVATGIGHFIQEDYKFILSSSTHCILLDIYRKCFEELDFEIEVNSLIKTLEKFFDIDKYVFASTDQELEATKNMLTVLLEKVQNQNAVVFATLTDVYKSVSVLMPRLSETFGSRLKFLEYMDKLFLLDKTIKVLVIHRYKQVLLELCRKITQLVEKIDADLMVRLEEGLEEIINSVRKDAKKVIIMAAVYVPLVKKILETLGQDVSWISWELAKVSATTFGIGLLGVAGFGTGAYMVHYYNTTYLRKKLRKEQGRR